MKKEANELVRIAKGLVSYHGFIEDTNWDKVSYTENMIWVFGFEKGGWNSEMAKTKKEAMAKATQKWGNSADKEMLGGIIDSSFHVATRKEWNSLLVD